MHIVLQALLFLLSHLFLKFIIENVFAPRIILIVPSKSEILKSIFNAILSPKIAFFAIKEDHSFSASRYPLLVDSKLRTSKPDGTPFLTNLRTMQC